MELILQRLEFNPSSTIGALLINGEKFCDTLEDTYRQLDDGTVDKIKGMTAIPLGRYQVIIDMSTRFNRLMPHVLNVPQFDGIRIHMGNTDVNTEGCILLGLERGPDLLVNSLVVFNKFFDILTTALKTEQCWITITTND